MLADGFLTRIKPALLRATWSICRCVSDAKRSGFPEKQSPDHKDHKKSGQDRTELDCHAVSDRMLIDLAFSDQQVEQQVVREAHRKIKGCQTCQDRFPGGDSGSHAGLVNPPGDEDAEDHGEKHAVFLVLARYGKVSAE